MMYQLVRIGSAMPTLHYRTKPIACSGVRVAGNLLGTTLSFRTPFRLRAAHSGSRLPSAAMNGFPFTLQCNRELANSAPDLLRVQGSESQLQLLWPHSALAVAVYGSYIYIALGCGSGRKETVVQIRKSRHARILLHETANCCKISIPLKNPNRGEANRRCKLALSP
jgi:hypothetical protein